MKNRISERLAEAIDACAPKNGKYAWLESISDIPTTSWKSALSGRQRPTVEMLECFCRSQPNLAFYVVTGTLPRKELEHTDPYSKQLEKMDIELEKILAKEPVDWSKIELDFAIMNLRNGGYFAKDIDSGALDIAIEANIKKQLLESFLNDEQTKLELALHDAKGDLNSEHGESGASFDLASFKESAAILKGYRASKK
jgi:hypothetical protein